MKNLARAGLLASLLVAAAPLGVAASEAPCGTLEGLRARSPSETSPHAERSAVANAFASCAAREGTPLVVPAAGPGRVRFLFALRSGAARVFLAGDMNGWSTSSHPLEKLPGSDLHVLELEVPDGARLDYKFVAEGTEWMLDPWNPRTMAGGFGPNSELQDALVRPARGRRSEAGRSRRPIRGADDREPGDGRSATRARLGPARSRDVHEAGPRALPPRRPRLPRVRPRPHRRREPPRVAEAPAASPRPRPSRGPQRGVRTARGVRAVPRDGARPGRRGALARAEGPGGAGRHGGLPRSLRRALGHGPSPRRLRPLRGAIDRQRGRRELRGPPRGPRAPARRHRPLPPRRRDVRVEPARRRPPRGKPPAPRRSRAPADAPVPGGARGAQLGLLAGAPRRGLDLLLGRRPHAGRGRAGRSHARSRRLRRGLPGSPDRPSAST